MRLCGVFCLEILNFVFESFVMETFGLNQFGNFCITKQCFVMEGQEVGNRRCCARVPDLTCMESLSWAEALTTAYEQVHPRWCWYTKVPSTPERTNNRNRKSLWFSIANALSHRKIANGIAMEPRSSITRNNPLAFWGWRGKTLWGALKSAALLRIFRLCQKTLWRSQRNFTSLGALSSEPFHSKLLDRNVSVSSSMVGPSSGISQEDV